MTGKPGQQGKDQSGSGNSAWWAKPFAFENAEAVYGYLAVALLLLSIAYGICKWNELNFKADTPAAGVTKPAAEVEKTITPVGFHKALIIGFWVLLPPC